MTMTTLQIETLKLVRDGAVSMANAGTAAYRIRGAKPSVVGRLVSLKLALWPKGPVGEQTCWITERGKAVLASVE
ncbi:MAG: hypothetical protein H6Q99_293 [Proteobacteria bacterium]|nr:hypothetical protein [Pseudomonadota bacterium]